jgi:acetyl esterase/lipase
MRRAALLGTAACVLALAGCGGEASQSTAPTGPSGKPEPPPRGVWGKPAGPNAGKRPKAVVMLIHGGGWQGLNGRALATEVAIARVLRRLGYETLTIDYRRGAAGIADADRFYRQARHRFGPRFPICADGTSAGGHVALMLAVRHPDLTCAISLAGPTDLPALNQEHGGGTAYKLAEQAFGTDRLAEFSPALRARSIRARILLVVASNDPVVPLEQARRLRRVLPAVRVIVVPPGRRDGRFVHSRVDAAAAARAGQAQIAFLGAAVARARRHGG